MGLGVRLIGSLVLASLWTAGAAQADDRFDGIVVDGSGAPIPGAIIAGPGWELQADAAGRFTLHLPRGERRILVRSPGYASIDTFGDAPEGGRIVLEREARISGQLIDRSTRGSIAQARLLLHGTSLAQGRTDKEGHFLFSGLPAGSYQLEARAPGRFARAPQTIEVEAREEVKLLLEARPAFTVRAEVSVELSGQPCSKPYVVMRSGLDLEEARGDARGQVVFEAVPSGRYTAVVTCKDQGQLYLPGLVVGADSPSLHRWVISRGRQLRGRVRDRAGRAVARTGVYYTLLGTERLRGAMTLTDEQGSFVLRGLPEGPIEVTATLDDVHTSTVVGPGHGDVEGLLLQPPLASANVPPAQVEGVLASVDGQPMRSTELTVSTEGGLPTSVLTDRAGRFSLLVSPGPVEVALSSRISFLLSNGARALEAWADPGAVTQLYLGTVPAGRRIHGRVLGTDEAPLADALVVAVLEREGPAFSGIREGWARPAAQARTDQAGAFVLSGLGEGSYRLRATGGRGARGPAVVRDVAAPGTALIKATPLRTLRGRVLGLDSASPLRLLLSNEELEWTKEIEATSADGQLIIHGVPDGRISVAARSLDGGAYAIHEGDDPFELRLSPLGPLRVHVRDEAGHPAARCELTIYGALDDRFGSTDLDGDLVFEGVGPGPHRVEVFCAGDAPAPEERCADVVMVELPTSGRYEPVRFRLPVRARPPETLLAQLGLTLRGNKVHALRVGGPAMQAGLRVGDELSQVDGYDVIARPKLIECLLRPGVPLELRRGLRTTLPAP